VSGGSRSLPVRPSLRFLRLEAKRRLAAGEFATLHEAQAAIAWEHGLPSWAELKQACASSQPPEPAQESHALAQLRWLISRFSDAGYPGWTPPADDELAEHFDDRLLAAVPAGPLVAQLSKAVPNTVLVSSHLMSEMALSADHLIVIGRGKLLADMPTAQLIAANARHDVLLRSPRAAELAGLLTARGATVTPQPDGALVVTGLDAAAIGDLAASHGVAVHALVPRQASLEDAYLDLTGESVDYHGTP